MNPPALAMATYACQAEGCGATFTTLKKRENHCKEQQGDQNHAAAYWYCPLEGCRYSRQAQEEEGKRSRGDAMLSHLVTRQHNIVGPDDDKKNGKPLPVPIREKLRDSAMALTDANLAMKARDLTTFSAKSVEAHALWYEATQMIKKEEAAMKVERNLMPTGQQKAMPTGQQNTMSMQQDTRPVQQDATDMQQQHAMDMQQYHGTFTQQQQTTDQQQYATGMDQNAMGMQPQTMVATEEPTEDVFLIIYFSPLPADIRYCENPMYMLAAFKPAGGDVPRQLTTVWQLDRLSGSEVQVGISDLPAQEHWRGCWLSNEEFQRIGSMATFVDREDIVKGFSNDKRLDAHSPMLPGPQDNGFSSF
ncbi:hypothetical protein F5X68DRAFT_193904 [Plectosphaerella plurivora]|uniref:Uncharacterized protein n=1 Tax=Plectosphaerella plurivora TaxID=936078 RepID=A0A9P8V5U8_9PEZI|nr:hypothetical protein F5X68DRAFT_193904 [Plectosphaerella plurivora]